MTAAKVEEFVLNTTEALAIVREDLKNVRESCAERGATAERLRDSLSRLELTVAGLGKDVAAVEKALNELEARSEESKKHRFAIGLSVFSALLSLGTAVVVAYLGRSR